MVRKKENINLFWLSAIQKYIDDTDNLKFIEVPDKSWMEVDYHPDYNTVKDKIEGYVKKLHFLDFRQKHS